jgi:hypothetical protein
MWKEQYLHGRIVMKSDIPGKTVHQKPAVLGDTTGPFYTGAKYLKKHIRK